MPGPMGMQMEPQPFRFHLSDSGMLWFVSARITGGSVAFNGAIVYRI
jgi:hypothetical protein